MSAASLLNELSRVAGDDYGVSKTRRFILDLAVGGALVPANRDGDSGGALLDSITAHGSAAFGAKWRDRLQKLHPISSPPFTLASHWAWVPFGSLMDLVRGVTYTKSDVAEGPAKGYLPILRANNIRDGLNFHELVYVRENRVAPEQMPREGDYVLALSSGSKNLVGKAAFVTRDFPGGIGGFCGILRVASPGIGPFVGIYLASQLYREAIALGSRGIGINNLQRGALDNLPFPLPPLGEQQRIVAKVNELMALCDELEAAQTNVEARRDQLRTTSLRNLVAPDESKENARFFLRHSPRMITKPEHVASARQTILDLAVRGRLVSQDAGDEPADRLLQRIAEERNGSLARKRRNDRTPTPEATNHVQPPVRGWAMAKVRDVTLNVTDGFHNTPPPVAVGRPYVTATHVKATGIDFANCLFVSESDHKQLFAKTRVRRGDILVVNIGAGCGTPAIVEVDFEFSFKNVAVLGLPHAIDARYVFYWLLGCRSALFEEVTKGGAQPFLGLSMLREVVIPIPPLAEQHRIVAKVDELMAVCDQLERSLATEQTQRARLLEALLHDALDDALPARELELLKAQ